MLQLNELTYAVNYKQKEMAWFFIDKCTNMNSTFSNLKTPLHFAYSKLCILECQGFYIRVFLDKIKVVYYKRAKALHEKILEDLYGFFQKDLTI